MLGTTLCAANYEMKVTGIKIFKEAFLISDFKPSYYYFKYKVPTYLNS